MSTIINLWWPLQFCIILNSLMFAQNVKPNGGNTCVDKESINVTIDVEEDYQQQYRDTKWCLNIPPRCTVYKWRWAKRVVPKVVMKTREVTRCCAGYVENLDGDCKPSCEEPCRHGACTMPNTCSCFPGFKGRLCQELCSRRTWGRNCTQQCECQNGAFCNPMNGSCLCPPGWRGLRCSEPCKEGYFGMDCRLPCFCEMGENISCHHITGECIIPSTTELYTTTEISTTTTEMLTTTEVDSTTTAETETTKQLIVTSTIIFSTTESAISTFPESTWSFTNISTTSFPDLRFTDLSTTLVPFTEINYRNTTANNIGENQITVMPEIEYQSNMEIARLAITVSLSVLGSLILLFAAAGLALSRRKTPSIKPEAPSTPLDAGLYSCCPERPSAANIVIPNPSYGFGHYETAMENVHFPTFHINEDLLQVEVTDVLEGRYDYPTSSISFDHVYAEIDSAATEFLNLFLTRLRLGLTHLTHSYLLNHPDPPPLAPCHSPHSGTYPTPLPHLQSSLQSG